ncbi:MAG: hypothetical protein HYU64_08400 [Armatimonadetes bacterium]|nr:hypothetical protein [Armatimonadota bacterium]
MSDLGKISAYDQSKLLAEQSLNKRTTQALESRAVHSGVIGEKGKETKDKEEKKLRDATLDEFLAPQETEAKEGDLKTSKFEDGRTQTESPNGVVRQDNQDGSFLFSLPDGYVINNPFDKEPKAFDLNTNSRHHVTVAEENDGQKVFQFKDSEGRVHRVNGETLDYRTGSPGQVKFEAEHHLHTAMTPSGGLRTTSDNGITRYTGPDGNSTITLPDGNISIFAHPDGTVRAEEKMGKGSEFPSVKTVEIEGAGGVSKAYQVVDSKGYEHTVEPDTLKYAKAELAPTAYQAFLRRGGEPAWAKPEDKKTSETEKPTGVPVSVPITEKKETEELKSTQTAPASDLTATPKNRAEAEAIYQARDKEMADAMEAASPENKAGLKKLMTESDQYAKSHPDFVDGNHGYVPDQKAAFAAMVIRDHSGGKITDPKLQQAAGNYLAADQQLSQFRIQEASGQFGQVVQKLKPEEQQELQKQYAALVEQQKKDPKLNADAALVMGVANMPEQKDNPALNDLRTAAQAVVATSAIEGKHMDGINEIVKGAPAQPPGEVKAETPDTRSPVIIEAEKTYQAKDKQLFEAMQAASPQDKAVLQSIAAESEQYVKSHTNFVDGNHGYVLDQKGAMAAMVVRDYQGKKLGDANVYKGAVEYLQADEAMTKARVQDNGEKFDQAVSKLTNDEKTELQKQYRSLVDLQQKDPRINAQKGFYEGIARIPDQKDNPAIMGVRDAAQTVVGDSAVAEEHAKGIYEIINKPAAPQTQTPVAAPTTTPATAPPVTDGATSNPALQPFEAARSQKAQEMLSALETAPPADRDKLRGLLVEAQNFTAQYPVVNGNYPMIFAGMVVRETKAGRLNNPEVSQKALNYLQSDAALADAKLKDAGARFNGLVQKGTPEEQATFQKGWMTVMSRKQYVDPTSDPSREFFTTVAQYGQGTPYGSTAAEYLLADDQVKARNYALYQVMGPQTAPQAPEKKSFWQKVKDKMGFGEGQKPQQQPIQPSQFPGYQNYNTPTQRGSFDDPYMKMFLGMTVLNSLTSLGSMFMLSSMMRPYPMMYGMY